MVAAGRKVVVVNLDPANDALPYPVAIDLKELIAMEEVMETFQLGPNGGLMYCIEYLEKNLSWLRKKIKEHAGRDNMRQSTRECSRPAFCLVLTALDLSTLLSRFLLPLRPPGPGRAIHASPGHEEDRAEDDRELEDEGQQRIQQCVRAKRVHV
jgi:hypothetical protein